MGPSSRNLKSKANGNGGTLSLMRRACFHLKTKTKKNTVTAFSQNLLSTCGHGLQFSEVKAKTITNNSEETALANNKR